MIDLTIDRLVKLSLILGVLLIGGSYAYSNFIIPYMTQDKLERCLEDVKRRTQDPFIPGRLNLGENPEAAAAAKEECFKKYSQAER